MPAEEIDLSVLVVGELRRGIESIRRRDTKQAAALERWLARFTTDHGERILPVDSQVADQWGPLKAKQPGSVIDTLMAATALVHGLVLVTRNVKDVEWTGSLLPEPFRAGFAELTQRSARDLATHEGRSARICRDSMERVGVATWLGRSPPARLGEVARFGRSGSAAGSAPGSTGIKPDGGRRNRPAC